MSRSKVVPNPTNLAGKTDSLSSIEKKRVKGSTVTPPHESPEPPRRIKKRKQVKDTYENESKAGEDGHPELTVTPPYESPEPPRRRKKRKQVKDTYENESKAGEDAHPELTDTYAKLKKRWVVSVEEDIETCDAITNSHLGSKFIEWVLELELNEQKDKPGANLDIDLAKYLPPIDVSVKIYAIYDVDVPNNSFECTFNVMLDWEDPSLALLALPDKESSRLRADHASVGTLSGQQKRARKTKYVYQRHFAPKYEVRNVMEKDNQRKGSAISAPRTGSSLSDWRVTWTTKFESMLRVPLNPQDFPFDAQLLVIKIEPVSAKPSSLQLGPSAHSCKVTPELQHPVRWRRSHGHTIMPNGDWLADFEVIGISGYRGAGVFETDYDTYTIAVAIVRNPTNTILNIVVSQIVTSLLGAMSFFLEGFNDAIALVMTALLTSIAFKLVLADSLPRTPYPTVVECYMIMSMALFLCQGVFNLIVRMLRVNALINEHEGCVPEEMWFVPNEYRTGVVDEFDLTYTPTPKPTQKPINASATSTSIPRDENEILTCYALININKILLGVWLLLFSLQQFFFIAKLFHKSSLHKVVNKTWSVDYHCINFPRLVCPISLNIKKLINSGITEHFLRAWDEWKRKKFDQEEGERLRGEKGAANRRRRETDAMTEIFKQQSAFLKEEERAHRKQERRLKKRRSSFDDSLTAGTSKKSKIMSNIFNLPRMSCHFMQYGDADNPTQMLAARHLHAEYAFKIAKENKNVPTQDMMHTPCLLGECEKCCNGQYEHCRLPRTWCIGQCINFGAPYNPDGTPTKYVWQRKLSKDVWWVDPRYYKLAIISEMIKANEKQMSPFRKIQNKIDPRISLKTERIHSLMNAPH